MAQELRRFQSSAMETTVIAPHSNKGARSANDAAVAKVYMEYTIGSATNFIFYVNFCVIQVFSSSVYKGTESIEDPQVAN